MNKKILILGSTSMVGSRFVELFPDKKQLLTPSSKELDLLKKFSVAKYLTENECGIILNFTAHTNVSSAELERNNKEGLCWQLNCNAVKSLVEFASKYNAHLIHISTDMVFSGSLENKGPYKETDAPENNPDKLTWYGYSKLVGEGYIDGEKSTLVRIIYPVRAHFKPKLDFFRNALYLFDQGKLYPLFNDQYISNTYIDDLYLALLRIIDNKHFGIYHIGTPNLTTPYDSIRMLLKKTNRRHQDLQAVSIDSIVGKNRYPKYGGLSVDKTEKALDIKFKTTNETIDCLVKQGIGD